jgi:phosphohistidine phosphatase SixA
MTLTAGLRLGPYEIVSPIGAGGMGEVYRARDTRLERTVAIKVLPTKVASDGDLRQRFEREAKTISSLSHPNICTLHDVGHEGGIDYLVMEHLEGESLQERLKKGPLPLAQVLRHAVGPKSYASRVDQMRLLLARHGHATSGPDHRTRFKDISRPFEEGVAVAVPRGRQPLISPVLPVKALSATSPGLAAECNTRTPIVPQAGRPRPTSSEKPHRVAPERFRSRRPRAGFLAGCGVHRYIRRVQW